jgi:hypothetical protein
MARIPQEHQIPKEIEILSSILQRSAQNLWELEFSDLPQIDQWKRRSCFVDHISRVRFEFEGLDLQESRVLDENHKKMVWGLREIQKNGLKFVVR